MRMHPLGDQRSSPRKALVLNLPPQAGLIRTALCEAALEVRDIRIDFPGATIAALVEREGLGPDPAADGLGIEATRHSNLAEGLPPFKCRVFSCCFGRLWLSYRLLVLSSATLGPGFGHHLPSR